MISRKMIIAYTQVPEIITTSWLNRLSELVPGNFLKTINLQKKPGPLARSLAGRYLLSEILKSEGQPVYDLSISLDSFKRPLFVGSPWKFSISHSDRLVVCACTRDSEVGIDLEKISSIDPVDFVPQFTDAQLTEVMDPVTYPFSFYKLWTAKEAVSKATGKGLYTDFKQIVFSDEGQCLLEHCLWYTKELKISPGYCCTLATDFACVAYDLKKIDMQYTDLP